MKKLGLLYINLFLISLGVMAQGGQFPSQVWHKGQIQLNSGTVYQGMVKYDLENNLVQLQNQGIETFSSSNVQQFEIFDEQYGGIRTFYTLPFPLTGDYETPVFFEILTEGEDAILLCREQIVIDNRGMGYGPMAMNPLWGPQMGGAYKLAFNFYFIKDGRIYKYSQKKKELLDILGDRADEVDLFMRKNRLSHDKRGDLLRITAYYNQIK
ncbi:hypothetical protein A33Q_0971 [Indibacter alkaliphilus LW1]|jgi:hypothetical protein|uniref:GLPGLI family protein n=1 Tax=Indibacter alkaliphilus (strain CCUG 57479 / KCTC 22604 / LW1) TaxID=1189612 RepID=S2DH04_INDAL|nr:hypothetical protein [Indibacter alkaliphilus]EOZ98317.1 hypothetical protein A33Q_0971 [Indibacter alkaliphilus LW1]